MKRQPSLSIVIPVGPSETRHLLLLKGLSELSENRTCQIVISGCEPTEPEYSFAEETGCIHVAGPAGRAAQLNRGVAASSGRCLWLLHADSRPTPDTLACAAAFSRSCHSPGTGHVLGWFPLSFLADGPRLAALNAAGANLRSRVLGLPFGDQAWLMRRDTFDALEGFDEHFGLGEDLDFIRRARRAGVALRRQNAKIETSARRYREHGWLRTTLAHLWLTLGLSLKSAKRSRGKPN